MWTAAWKQLTATQVGRGGAGGKGDSLFIVCCSSQIIPPLVPACCHNVAMGQASRCQCETRRGMMRKLQQTVNSVPLSSAGAQGNRRTTSSLSVSPAGAQNNWQESSDGTAPPMSLDKVIVASVTAVRQHCMLYMDMSHAIHCPLTHIQMHKDRQAWYSMTLEKHAVALSAFMCCTSTHAQLKCTCTVPYTPAALHMPTCIHLFEHSSNLMPVQTHSSSKQTVVCVFMMAHNSLV